MDLSTDAREIIDDEGNLLGVINVVDALVLLLVLAVVVAGAILVLGGDDDTAPSPKTGTTFVTLDLGTHPDYIVSALNVGDTYVPSSTSNLTITDLSFAPEGDQTHIVARARLDGVIREDTLNYANAPLRLDRSLEIRTDAYSVTGQISDVGDQSTLDAGTTTLLLQDNVSANDAGEITSGDEVTVAGRTAATVEDVAVYPTTNPDRRRVLVEANVSSYTTQDTRRFGGTALRTGQQVILPTDDYTITGRIERVDTGLQSRELTNRTVTLELTKVREDTANAIRAGQTEQAGTVPTAYVTNVETEPIQIITTAQDGSIVVSDHPTLRDVTLTTELRVTETMSGVQFRGERLQLNSTAVLDLGPVTVETRVVSIGR